MNKETNSSALEELLKWAAEEVPNGRRDKPFLKKFLLGCKGRINKAKDKLKNYHELREASPEWFTNRDANLPLLKELLDMGIFLPLLEKDSEGRTIIIVRATINSPRTQPMMDVFKISFMVLDAFFEEDETIAEKGVIVIIDLDQVNYSHALQMTIPLIRKTVHSWQNCYPIMIKGFHFINSPAYVNVILRIFKSFMTDKLKRRIHVHGKDLKQLPSYVSESLLPKEYGGKNGTLAPIIKHWRDFINGKQEWFRAQEKHGVNKNQL